MHKYVEKLKESLRERETSLNFQSENKMGSLWVDGDSLYLSLSLGFSMKVKDIIPSVDYGFYDVIGFDSALFRIKFSLDIVAPIMSELGNLPILMTGKRGTDRLIIEGDDVYSYLTDFLFGEVLVKKEFYCKRDELIQTDTDDIIRKEGSPESMTIHDVSLYLGWGE